MTVSNVIGNEQSMYKTTGSLLLYSNVRTMKYYSRLTFIGHSGSKSSAFYFSSTTSAGLNCTSLYCACASIKRQSSCTVISVPCTNKLLVVYVGVCNVQCSRLVHFVLWVHTGTYLSVNLLTNACSHTSLIVTIQWVPATTVGPTNFI